MNKVPAQTRQLIKAINESINDKDTGTYDVVGVLAVLLYALAISVFLNILAYT